MLAIWPHIVASDHAKNVKQDNHKSDPEIKAITKDSIQDADFVFLELRVSARHFFYNFFYK